MVDKDLFHLNLNFFVYNHQMLKSKINLFEISMNKYIKLNRTRIRFIRNVNR